jgi:uncharacterized protein (DUF952 family)/GNAT superfamily N-acetyltransferase
MTVPQPWSAGTPPAGSAPPGPAVRLRGADRADLPALRTLDPSLAAEADGTAGAGDPAQLLAAAVGPAAPHRPVLLVADPGSGPVGYALLLPAGFYGRDFVARLVVAPSLQRRGLGTMLLQAAVAAARTSRVFTSASASSQPMRALLTARGWTPAGALDGLNADVGPGRADLELVSYLDTPHPTGPQTRLLRHLALARDWEAARLAGEYRVSTLGLSLAQVGFVHACLTAAQLRGVAERFYAGVAESLVLLTIDRDRLTAPVLIEPVASAGAGPDAMFPHVYGPVDADAVIDVQPLTRNAVGGWELP